MLELYQFEISQYSEKVRLILDYKGLEYRKIEVTPGVGQLELLRMTGKTQVPVLKDGETIVTDSTEIAFYLERKYPSPALIPEDPLSKGLCLMMEEWADESIGLKGRKAFIGALNQYRNFRTSILPNGLPDFVKSLVSSVPRELFDVLGAGIGFGPDAVKEAEKGLKQDLDALCLILENRPYLLGDQPSLADLSVAGLSMILKFPSGGYLDLPEELKGKGIPGIADNSAYDRFFQWRDRLYSQYRRTSSVNTNPSTGTTTINID